VSTWSPGSPSGVFSSFFRSAELHSSRPFSVKSLLLVRGFPSWGKAGVTAFLTGLLLWLSGSEDDMGFLAFFAFVPFLWTVSSPRAGVWQGALVGLVSFGLILRWLTVVHVAGWIILSVWLSLQWALFGAVVGALAQRKASFLIRLLILPSVLTVLEFARGRQPFGGFAWAELGVSQHSFPFTRSLAAVGGVALLTWVICAVNVALAGLLVERSGQINRRVPGLVLAAVVVVFALGWWGRPLAAPAGFRTVGLVQGNVFESHSLSGSGVPRGQMLSSHVELTRVLPDDVDLVVWGESSLNGFAAGGEVMPGLGEMLVEVSGGVPLLGNLRVENESGDLFENTSVLFDAGGRQQLRYVKRELVPFGEFVPFREELRFIRSLGKVPIDAVRGDRLGLFSLDGIRAGTLICFESIFSDPARETVAEGATLLIVVTNNASYGRSALSDQYLALTRMRAVETHRAISVAAISGRSALIASEGTLLATTKHWDPATLVWDMPYYEDRTWFVRFGNWVFPFSVFLIGVGLFLVRRGTKQEKQ